MVPELPEIVNGIQFALQNNISLRYEHNLLFAVSYEFAHSRQEGPTIESSRSAMQCVLFVSPQPWSGQLHCCAGLHDTDTPAHTLQCLPCKCGVLVDGWEVDQIIVSNDSHLFCPGCWLHARVQWHPPLVQHLQRHSGQLHFHGWEMRLLSGWVMTPDFKMHRNNRRIFPVCPRKYARSNTEIIINCLFAGTALVVVYLILLALYFFAPSPRSCWSAFPDQP